MVRDKGCVSWAGEPLCVWYAFQVGRKAILSTQALNLRRAAYISTDDVQHKVAFADTMKSLLCYEQAFEDDYSMRVVDVSIMDMVDDLFPQMFWLPALDRHTYAASELER